MTLAQARQLIAARDYTQAREVLLPLAAAAPHDAEIQYETACVHDSLGFEAEAVPFYRAAQRSCGAHKSPGRRMP